MNIFARVVGKLQPSRGTQSWVGHTTDNVCTLFIPFILLALLSRSLPLVNSDQG